MKLDPELFAQSQQFREDPQIGKSGFERYSIEHIESSGPYHHGQIGRTINKD